jgi:hypothetical protein
MYEIPVTETVASRALAKITVWPTRPPRLTGKTRYTVRCATQQMDSTIPAPGLCSAGRPGS